MSTKRIEAKKEHLKSALIEAYHKTLGNVSAACEVVGIPRKRFYEIYNQDEEFKTACEAVKEKALDFAESALMNQIKEGNTTAIIFYLKTQGKRRGYIERQELTGADEKPLFDGLNVKIVK